jgi:hypothetical protein
LSSGFEFEVPITNLARDTDRNFKFAALDFERRIFRAGVGLRPGRQEKPMSKPAIRLLTLALCTTALALAPTVTPAKAATSSSGHVHKHKKHWRAHVSEPWYVGQAQPFVPPYSQAGPICPGISRGIDCRIFPPPIDVDPDRRVPKF